MLIICGGLAVKSARTALRLITRSVKLAGSIWLLMEK